MKKLVLLVAGAMFFTACDNLGKKTKQLELQKDSLMVELSKRDAELDGIMNTFNSIQEGFQKINEAEGRVLAQRESGTLSTAEQIQSDMEFIVETMKRNREQIEDLQQKLKSSNQNSAQLKKAIESFKAELAQKTEQLIRLQTELAEKNIRIEKLDATVAQLKGDSLQLAAKVSEQEKVLDAQDKALNAAWFVYGTKSELKEQNILETKFLQKGKVLQNDDFNKDYFTQIDIRKDKEIKLYSKSAKLLTSHPEGSYVLARDSKDLYVLQITNPTDFWSVSRYLVIQVK